MPYGIVCRSEQICEKTRLLFNFVSKVHKRRKGATYLQSLIIARKCRIETVAQCDDDQRTGFGEVK